MKWNDRNHDYINDVLASITSTDEHYQCACGQAGKIHNDNPDVSDKAIACMASDKAFSLLCLGEI